MLMLTFALMVFSLSANALHGIMYIILCISFCGCHFLFVITLCHRFQLWVGTCIVNADFADTFFLSQRLPHTTIILGATKLVQLRHDGNAKLRANQIIMI